MSRADDLQAAHEVGRFAPQVAAIPGLLAVVRAAQAYVAADGIDPTAWPRLRDALDAFEAGGKP